MDNEKAGEFLKWTWNLVEFQKGTPRNQEEADDWAGSMLSAVDGAVWIPEIDVYVEMIAMMKDLVESKGYAFTPEATCHALNGWLVCLKNGEIDSQQFFTYALSLAKQMKRGYLAMVHSASDELRQTLERCEEEYNSKYSN